MKDYNHKGLSPETVFKINIEDNQLPHSELTAQERVLRLQDEDTRRQWDEEAGLVIQRRDTDPQYEQQFVTLLEKYNRSSMFDDSRLPGTWTQMIFEMVEDEELGNILETYANSEQLQFIEMTWTPEREKYLTSRWEPLLEERAAVQGQEKKLLLLHKLLESTQRHFRYKPEDRYPEEHAILTMAWSDILGSFRRKRMQTIRERMEKALPDIAEIKKKVIGRAGTALAPRALDRLNKIPIFFGDEYVEKGTIFEFGRGVYMSGKSPHVRVTGKTTLDRSKTRRNISHELNHVRSGHGDPLVENESEAQTEEVHVLGSTRVGVYSEGSHSAYWLNEAITEERNGELMEIPDNEQTYPASRALKKFFIQELGIAMEDINEWYETEGDDTVIKQKLVQKYPALFSTLNTIEELKNDLLQKPPYRKESWSIEELTPEDFQKILDIVRKN